MEFKGFIAHKASEFFFVVVAFTPYATGENGVD